MKRLMKRVKVWGVSALAFCVSAACTFFGIDFGPPTPTCYIPPEPTPTPEMVTCYEPVVPVFKATPKPAMPGDTPKGAPLILCYVMPAPTLTPTPTPEPEGRDVLRGRLLAEGRFPESVAQEL